MLGRLTICATVLATFGLARDQVHRDREAFLKERPVMKVVRLLQDMKVELQRDLEDDKAVHEKLACWCETNEKEKTQAIDVAEARISQLQSSMDESTATILKLKESRKAALTQLYEDQDALSKAREIRMKENKAFHGEETDLMEAIAACKQAIVVLSKHHPELAQIRAVAQRLQNARVAQLVMTSQKLLHEEKNVMTSFMQQANAAPSFLGIPGYQSYAPQSGQIFGILKQMQEDFSRSLSDAQSSENDAQKAFEALKAANEEEIASGKKSIVQFDEDLAQFGEKHAQAAQEFQDTEDKLALDREFLASLKKKCSESEGEFDARMKARLEEISAVEDSIGILNSDEAFATFDKSVNAALLQTSTLIHGQSLRRQRASVLLRRAADKLKVPKLALLAASAQLDAFTKVREEIDKLIAELKQQQTDEVDHRDWCVDELNTNERSTAAANDKKMSLEAKKNDLTKTIDTLTADIEAAQAAIAEMQRQMQRASETREAESADNQQTITDQRLAQMVLAKALQRMKQVYALFQQPMQPGAPHMELSGTKTDPGNGPARFTKYEKHGGGSRVVAMIEEVVADSKKTEDDTIRSEEDAQASYEYFMKDSNKAIIKYTESITSMSEAKAQAKASLSMATDDLKQTMGELEALNEFVGDLHVSCDFLLKNFDARQAARASEMEALSEAKGVLSGMK